MGILAYLLVPAIMIAVILSVLWVRNRKPNSIDAHIEGFQRELRALSPDRKDPDGRSG